MCSDRTLVSLAVASLVLVSGCRNLVHPEPQGPPTRTLIAGRVVNPNGTGTQATVELDNSPYVPRVDHIRWSSETDDLGRFQAELPRGRYDVRLRFPSVTTLPDYTAIAVEFGSDETEVTYDLEPQRGRVILPQEFPPTVFLKHELRFGYLPNPSVSITVQWLRGALAPNGDFEAWLADAEHTARLFGDFESRLLYIDYRWPDLIRRQPDTELELTVPLVPVRLRLTVRGNEPIPAGSRVELRRLGGSGYVRLYTDGDTVLIQTWAFAGPNEITVWGTDTSAFLPDTRFVDVVADSAISTDLGAHRVGIRVVDEEGTPRVGATAEVDGGSYSLSRLTGVDGFAVFYLDPGEYSISARRSFATVNVYRVVSVDDDATFEVVVP